MDFLVYIAGAVVLIGIVFLFSFLETARSNKRLNALKKRMEITSVTVDEPNSHKISPGVIPGYNEGEPAEKRDTIYFMDPPERKT